MNEKSKAANALVQSSLGRILLGLAVLSLTGVTALAQTRPGIAITNDGREVIATKGQSKFTAADTDSDAGLKTIAGNLSTDKYATYFSWFGSSVFGSGSPFQYDVWNAIPFTPSADASVTKIEVAVLYLQNTDTHFDLSIYSDTKGLPGKPIKTFLGNASTEFNGSCCKLVIANDASGIALKAGTQYWLVVGSNDKTHPAFFGAWAYNSTDMRTHPFASYCYSTGTQCPSNGWSLWQGGNILPAYAVLGN
ncbi:MAG TPA: choice-of-anchor R domain-containing protein [Terriglobales bacterium]|nr:choice-of-anchor R domain-containing protein [Terriglobales bacterium]